LIFLSSVFPLCERSAVNAKGQFHIENSTAFEKDEDSNTMAVDGQLDSAVYQCLWELQQYFSNPVSLFEKVGFNRLKMVMTFN
jgi:hypothetical protein